jgi:hypothetical protein
MAQEDIYFKMSGEPIEAVLVEKEEEMTYSGVFARTDMKLWPKLLPIKKFNVIPKVFIDDWSNIKVSLPNIDRKAELLRFPKVLDTEYYAEHLHIFRVPRINVKIPYEFVKELEIYNYTIKFDREVIRFKVHAVGGRAELVFNHNDDDVLVIIKYKDCEEWKVQLGPYKLYMFTHRRPDWVREE